MKKALFVLMIITIALTGFRKSDALVVSFNNDNSKAIDLSKKNTSIFSWSATNDTTKKGRRELGKGEIWIAGKEASDGIRKDTGDKPKKDLWRNGNGEKEGAGGKGKEGNGGKLGAGVAGKGGNGGNAKKEADGNGGAKKDLWVTPPAKKPQGNGGVGKDTAHNSDEKPFPLKNAAPATKEGNGGKSGAGVAGKGGNGGIGKDTAHNSDEKPFPLKSAVTPPAKPGSGN